MTGRYVYVLDNQGKIDMGATSADLKAISLSAGFDNAVSDPATILYFKAQDDNQYDVMAQGTGIHQIIDHYMKMRVVPNEPQTYLLYATNNNITKYLCDGEQNTELIEGVLSDNGKGAWRYWHVTPVISESDNYFGLRPALETNSGYFASFYASFPFSCVSSGLEAFYVSQVDADNGIAVLEKVDGTTVAGGTPLLIKCASKQPSDNRLQPGGTPDAAIGRNHLAGVYFQNDMHLHVNRLPYSKTTMRVPGVLPDGSLGFVTADIDYLPRNEAYLNVSEGTSATLRTMMKEDYDRWVAGIEPVYGKAERPSEIYTVFGVKVNVKSVKDLTPGIYIVDRKKLIVR